MINIRMQHKDVKKLTPKITVIGVGGAGGNAVNNMIGAGLQGAEFVVCNTDAQALEGSLCETRLQLGVEVTGGLGAGAKPEIGRAAAEESLDEVLQYLEGSNMAFITAGMGGGTGTGAAPVIARACRERGILTVGVVTKPFRFEGSLRMRMADAGIEEMQGYVDTLIVIPNQNLFRVANEKTTFAEAFRLADSVLQSAVRGVTDLIVNPGEVNLDFSDIRTAMQEMGKAMMGMGEASGEGRAIRAAEMAINNPLLDDVSMKGARGVIINVTGGLDMTLFEVDEACNKISEEVDPNANIIFGSTRDESMEGRIRVAIVATGIDVAEQKSLKRAPAVTVSTVAAPSERRPAPNYNEASRHAVEAALPRVSAHAASIALPADAVPAPRAAPVYTATMEATARKLEPETFQQEFAIETGKKPDAAAPAAPVQRATVYGNAFIPPQPIEPDTTRAGDAYGPSFGALTARRPEEAVPATPAVSGSGLNLKPPVPGSGTFHKKRTPSLFERFTSPLRHGAEETAAAPAPAPAAPIPQARTVQDSLAMELRRAEAADDELDIPAFLRRQAN